MIDDEVVALDVDTATYLGANKSAALLWQALAKGAKRDELVQRLADEYGLERDVAERDVDAFVHDLRSRELLEE